MSNRSGSTVLRHVVVGATGVLVAVGLALAAAFVPVPGLVTLAVAGAAAGWGWSRSGRPWPRGIGPSAVVVPLAVVAAMGWALAGGLVVPVGAAALTWVAAVRAQRAPGGHPVSTPALPPAPSGRGGDEDMGRWTDAQLCHVWRATYRQVATARTPQTLGALTECRRVILDQLELRDPAGFSAWMAAGARAAGNPEPYLSS